MRVERSIRIAASREQVWELVSSPDNYPGFLYGLSRLERKNETEGSGARFSMRMRVGSADVGGLIDVSKGWTLTIPDPAEISNGAARTIAAQEKVAPRTTTAEPVTAAPVIASR